MARELTRGICKLVLSTFDLVFQAFGIAPRSRDLVLHLLARKGILARHDWMPWFAISVD